MNENYQLNADRFKGFSKTYDNARPKMPPYAVEIIERYLNAKPDIVVDLGSGTGLSAQAWQNKCNQVIGIEPSEDMLAVAREKQTNNSSFIKAFSHDTGLPSEVADVVVCSQSFHWMNPNQTLAEVHRILKTGGVFATVDNDWPPVCNWQAELAYEELTNKVLQIESNNPNIRNTFVRWEKSGHLSNIKSSEAFRFAREIVFANREECDAGRLIELAISQGGLQTILKNMPEAILPQLNEFKKTVNEIFKDNSFKADFCYRMRIGIK